MRDSPKNTQPKKYWGNMNSGPNAGNIKPIICFAQVLTFFVNTPCRAVLGFNF